MISLVEILTINNKDKSARRLVSPIARLCTILPVLALTSCITLDQLDVTSSGTKEPTAETPAPTETNQLSQKGVEALRDNKFKEASVYFNRALKLDIQNSYLQLLNAMAYHMLAVRSDTTQFALAEQGYNLAIKFDPSNWIARYQLGLLHRDQRRFDKAKTSFADALFYRDDDPDILSNLAVSAYYSRCPQTASRNRT